MMRFIRSLLGTKDSKTVRKTRRPASRRTLGLEGLETRDLMAVAAINVANVPQLQPNIVAPSEVTIGISNHDLVIRGTDGPDDVKVVYKNGKYEVTVTTLEHDKTVHHVTTWRPSGGEVFFYGNRGNDKFYASFSSGAYLNVTASGGDGDDELTGSWGKDKLNGGNGSDSLIGQSGADTLDGGLGADYLDGRDGNDTLICGNDYEANDVFGGLGNDTITGSHGPDGLNGGGGNDTISGMDGDDVINGDGGNDYLYGGYGNDAINGGDGNDVLYGSQGNDMLWGGKGLDTCYGDDGNDMLYGNYDGQKDLLYGQDGRDTFRLQLKHVDQTWEAALLTFGGLGAPGVGYAVAVDADGVGNYVNQEDFPRDFTIGEDILEHTF